MPVLDGIHATRQIKNMFPDIIVIAFSSETESNCIKEMFAAGASEYIF